jgi:vacuolar protein sorting-associated protein 45
MDIVQAVSGYITKMVSAGDSAATGTTAAKMKILLLDNETVGLSPPSKPLRARTELCQISILSTATTQSALLNHEVYLTEYASPFDRYNGRN